MEFRFWFFCSQFDHIHFVQLFLTGHCHITGGNTGLVSGYKILQVCNFLLLSVVGGLQLGFFHSIHFLKFIIIAYIAVQFLIIHMIDQIDHTVQKWNIVADQDKGIFVIIQITFQPFNMLCIQIVGGLIQEKNIRFLQQKFAQQDLGTLPAG